MSKVKNGKTYKIEGMHCTSCASMLELDLEDAGVKASCSFSDRCVTVEENCNEECLKNVIEKSGYKIIATGLK